MSDPRIREGDFYEDDEPLEVIEAILRRPPDFVTAAGPPEDVVLPPAHVSALAEERLRRRADAEGKTLAQVLSELVEHYA